MRTSLLPCVVGVAATLALLSGCTSSESGSASPASSGSATSSSSSSSSGSSETPPTADELEAAVLQDGDLPSGWSGTPAEPDNDDEDGTAALMTCIGAEDNTADEVDEAQSPDFSTPDGFSISSSATSFDTQEAIDADVAVFSDPAAPGCFADQLRTVLDGSGLPAGSTVGDPQISFTPGSGDGPDNVVATATGAIPLTVNGQQITFYIDAAFITGRLTEASVEFFGVGSPVPADLQSSLVTAVADRVAAL